MENYVNWNRRQFIRRVGGMGVGVVLLGPVKSLLHECHRSINQASTLSDLQHIVVASEQDRFFAWPANNGLWSWNDGQELLVGHTDGPWVEQDGHNIGQPQLSTLVRSTDGGHTWKREIPKHYVGTDGEPEPSPGNIQFEHPDFTLRVAATGYHGTNDPSARFFISYDRGKTWKGSWRFNALNEDPELEGMEITSRTNYRVTGPDSCQIFMTARDPELQYASRLDKPFVAETNDGGKTFRFLSWAVPWSDQYRAAMPSTVRTSDGYLVMATRRRNPRDIEQPCWVDCFVSPDDGRTWTFLSEAGKTGIHNGNPPGLTALRDGRLACTYGNRSTRQMIVRISEDGGGTWGPELVIRDNPLNHDIGYPQITQNDDGKLVAIYYLATREQPHSYIEAAIWTP